MSKDFSLSKTTPLTLEPNNDSVSRMVFVQIASAIPPIA